MNFDNLPNSGFQTSGKAEGDTELGKAKTGISHIDFIVITPLTRPTGANFPRKRLSAYRIHANTS